MRLKSLAAVALTSALVLGGTTATANAQVSAPYPSSQIEIPQEFVNSVQNFVPGLPSDQAEAGLQVVTAWLALGVGSSVLNLGSSALGLGSSVLTSSL
ncbi:hypothetical protein [Corynebacterium halotolerans]|uniref:hypothetical protein n=1 Tax=Corynebacterium halotolerans TaxID=225326 RepID=UPI003CF0F347